MSTVNHEPNFGIPQTQEGLQMVGNVNPAAMAQPMGMPGMPTNPGMQAPVQQQVMTPPAQPQMQTGMPNIQGMPTNPGMQQMGIPSTQGVAHPEVNGMSGSVGAMVPPQMVNPGMQQITPPVNPAVQMPGQIQETNQFPTIQDGAPVAQMPNNPAAQVAQPQYQPQEMAQMTQMPGMPGMNNMQPDAAAQAAQINQIQQGYMGGTQQMQQYLTQPVGQPQYQQPQQPYNPMYGQQQPMQNPQQYQQPGMTAPGAANGSYLPGGNLGHTPTGHPEKQKFTAQARLIFVKNRPTKKNTIITTGLLSTNMNDRNAPASNFVCFSGSAAKQIDIIENMQVRPQYTAIEKASGQVIQFEGSWEWNSKSKEPGWQLMMDNFFFVSDPQLRNKAESYVPPIPASPMDMLMGGNMQGQQMYGQPQMQQGYAQPGMAMPNQQQGYTQPGMAGAPTNSMQQGYTQPQQNYGYQMPGMPGMPGQH